MHSKTISRNIYGNEYNISISIKDQFNIEIEVLTDDIYLNEYTCVLNLEEEKKKFSDISFILNIEQFDNFLTERLMEPSSSLSILDEETIIIDLSKELKNENYQIEKLEYHIFLKYKKKSNDNDNKMNTSNFLDIKCKLDEIELIVERLKFENNAFKKEIIDLKRISTSNNEKIKLLESKILNYDEKIMKNENYEIKNKKSKKKKQSNKSTLLNNKISIENSGIKNLNEEVYFYENNDCKQSYKEEKLEERFSINDKINLNNNNFSEFEKNMSNNSCNFPKKAMLIDDIKLKPTTIKKNPVRKNDIYSQKNIELLNRKNDYDFLKKSLESIGIKEFELKGEYRAIRNGFKLENYKDRIQNKENLLMIFYTKHQYRFGIFTKKSIKYNEIIYFSKNELILFCFNNNEYSNDSVENRFRTLEISEKYDGIYACFGEFKISLVSQCNKKDHNEYTSNNIKMEFTNESNFLIDDIKFFTLHNIKTK